MSAAAVLVLLLAVVLAAGCVSQDYYNQTRELSAGKFIVLQHNTDYNSSTISGRCIHFTEEYSYEYSFKENYGGLSVSLTRDDEPDNDTMKLFYGHSCTQKGAQCGNEGWFLYTFPWRCNTNLTIESVTGDGTVDIRYNNIPIVLKPKERWENTTHKIRITKPIQFGEGYLPGCTEDVTITESIYYAGVYDKKIITSRKTGDGS